MQPAAGVSTTKPVTLGQSAAITVQDKIKDGIAAADLEKARELFNECFVELCKAPNPKDPAIRSQLYDLLLAYSEKNLYLQEIDGDKHMGFRQSARVLELSFGMQLAELNLGAVDYEWNTFKSLEELARSLEVGPTEKGKFFPAFEQLNLDAGVLAAAADKMSMRKSVTATLTRLTYSHQNIPPMIESTASNITFHTKWNSITETLIGSNELAEKKALIDYKYNRTGFLLELKDPNDKDAQLKSYEFVLQELDKLGLKGDFEGDSLRAQCENMIGLTIWRAKKDNFATYALPHFVTSYTERKKLVERAEAGKQRHEQEQLLENVRGCVMTCKGQIVKEFAEELPILQADSAKFKAEVAARNDKNSYNK